MAKRIKYILFLLILLMLVAPALQSFFHFVPERNLQGDFDFLEQPKLNMDTWLDGSYQSGFDPWMEENIGFHPTLVRLRNQYDYSIFQIPHADGIVRGKGGQLFEYDYIRAWMGEDFVGEKLLDKKLRQFRYLQKQLKEEKNIDLVLVLEPGKASVYPEDIPDKYQKQEGAITNYEYLSKRALELDINLIDLNDYFIKIKDTVDYPLFPLQGTHWSQYACWYAIDSLLSYIEKTRDMQLREVIKKGEVWLDDLQSTDYDMGESLNLLCKLDHPAMPYLLFDFDTDSISCVRPNVLTIADSYYWNFLIAHIPKRIFNNEAFWYFYKQVNPDNDSIALMVDQLDLKTEVEKQDVIFLMATERFLYKFDRGFIDDLWDIYGLRTDADPIINNQTAITALDSWFNSVKEEADAAGVSLGKMMERKAIFLLWEQEPEKYYSLYGPEVLIKDIISDTLWYSQVQQRAAESNMSIEDRLKEEADYLLSIKYPEAHKKYHYIKQMSENIRADSNWLNAVKEKAARYYLTLDEMIRADAEYMYWMENR